MLDPIRLTTDIFKEKNLSYASLRAFTESFLIRLAQPELNPGGIYNTLLVDTTNRYNDYFGSVENKLVKAALKKGLTVSTNESIDRVFEQLKRMHGLVKFEFGKGSEVYEEFFPQKMEEYYTATIDNLPAKLDRFITAANTHLLAGYPVQVGNFIAAKNQFRSARAAQEGIFSEVKNITTGKHKHRKELTLQLTKCFLIIAADHIENPDRFDDYYDARFLPIRKAKKKRK